MPGNVANNFIAVLKMTGYVFKKILVLPLLCVSVMFSTVCLAEEDGRELISSNTCIACHSVDSNQQRIGPPFPAIGLRYKGATSQKIDELSENIIAGTVGKWGVVPMVSHPNVTKSEARKMIVWILNQDSE